MNRSKDRGADMESRNLQQAQKIVDMHDTVNAVYDSVNELKSKLDKIQIVSYNSWWL